MTKQDQPLDLDELFKLLKIIKNQRQKESPGGMVDICFPNQKAINRFYKLYTMSLEKFLKTPEIKRRQKWFKKLMKECGV